MTRLIDAHAPRHDVSESHVLHVDAAPEDVLAAVDALDLGRDAFAGVQARGRSARERLFGMRWHPTPGARGHVDIVWDIRVEPDEGEGSYLSSTRRFAATDAAAREAMLAQWRHVGANASTLARRLLQHCKRAAEGRSVLREAELLLAA